MELETPSTEERIVFVPKFGCFVVLGPTGKVYTVEIFPVEKNSCLIPHAACSHDLAVETILRMNDSSKAFATTNIGLIRTKARGKAKSGRKQPRPGDIKISERDDEPVITIQPTTDQDDEDTTESDYKANWVKPVISRNIHRIFTDLRTNSNYGLFTELSRTYGQMAITENSRNIHGFTIYLSLLSRSMSDHHLREKHSGWAIETIYKK